MKKYLIGFVLGVIVSISTASYASESIQALLSPVKLIINGESKDPDENGYKVLNYDNHVYVPLRYVAENFKFAVIYDDTDKTVSIDNRFNIIDPKGNQVKAGNLKVTKEKDGSSIQVQFYSENEIPSSFPVVGKLVFWDKQGVVMEKVPFQFTYKNGSQLQDTQLSVKSDVTGYEWATLEDVFPTTNHELPYPVDMIMSSHDTENKIRYGIKNSQGFKLGDHTLFQMYISSTSEKVFGDLQATAAFYDEANKIIGSAIIHTRLNGLDGQLVDISGQGDLTNYRTVLVNVDKFVPETH